MKYMPPTLISENLNEIRSFFKSHKSVVVKPVNGFSGNNVILFNSFKAKKIRKLLKIHNHLFFQKFLPGVSKGDKRVFIIKGKIVGAISRVPKKGSILSNMSKGAKAKLAKLTSKEIKASKVIGKLLVRNNIYFAGIDFVQEKLIGDINVTSPTGVAAYKDLTGINLAKMFWNNI
jgi:glutathione synthase